MRTVPLYGAKAAGRVALVDDGDYDLVMQYRWNVYERNRSGRNVGPYAQARSRQGRACPRIMMHVLLMGSTGIDHADHDGLNNRRSNLRPATHSQNMQNARTRVSGKTSQYKGVCAIEHGLWRAYIDAENVRCNLGDFTSEIEAAYTYDAAARKLHGVFACPNFPEGPTQAMRDQWQTEREQRSAALKAATRQALTDGLVRWWEQRKPETRICAECGEEYQSKSTQSSYCGRACKRRAARHRDVNEM